jgi:hypothetical protein
MPVSSIRPIRPIRAMAAVALGFALVGCAQPVKPLYHWDGFQRQMYEHFKGDGSSPGEQLLVLEAQAQKAAASGAALPPGFRAHLAVVYLKLGRDAEARQQLEGEKAAFPESAAYMDFLLKNAKSKNS